MQPSALEHCLGTIEVFSGLDGRERAELARHFATVALRRGDVLIRQGDPADALYVVVSGRFEVTVAERKTPLSEIGPDQTIGEIAFLAGGCRTATVRAMRDSLVLRLDLADFERLAAKSPTVWRSLTIRLARRLADTNVRRLARPDPRPRTIVLLRAGGGPSPIEFAHRLMAVFSAAARTLLVTPENAAELLPGAAAIDSFEATQALNALESRFDYVIFLADADASTWTQKVVRQADLALAVAQHSAPPEPNEAERLASEVLPAEAIRLVLLHPSRSRPNGTRGWLAGRRIAMHHHVCLDGDDDLERLFRLVNGTARGLVACGGGALCAAHVGLYKACIQAGLRFDVMGGTSAGSAMAAAFALGAGPDEVDAGIHDIFVKNKAMGRYTWPRYSLLDHTHFDRQLSKHFGGVDIEDLWIPYFAVSTNLSSYELHRHRTGDLFAAVRASASIPVLLPPFFTPDGSMLVDGCLLDNVPIRVMREMKSGPNIVVAFELPELARVAVDYQALPSREDLLRSVLDFRKRRDLPSAPGLVTVLMRSMMANRQDFKRHLAADDVLMMPPLPRDVGVLDWHRHSELVDAAYRWAQAELPRLGLTS